MYFNRFYADGLLYVKENENVIKKLQIFSTAFNKNGNNEEQDFFIPMIVRGFASPVFRYDDPG